MIIDDSRIESFEAIKDYYLNLLKKNVPVMQVVESAYFEGWNDGWDSCLEDGYDEEEDD